MSPHRLSTPIFPGRRAITHSEHGESVPFGTIGYELFTTHSNVAGSTPKVPLGAFFPPHVTCKILSEIGCWGIVLAINLRVIFAACVVAAACAGSISTAAAQYYPPPPGAYPAPYA